MSLFLYQLTSNNWIPSLHFLLFLFRSDCPLPSLLLSLSSLYSLSLWISTARYIRWQIDVTSQSNIIITFFLVWCIRVIGRRKQNNILCSVKKSVLRRFAKSTGKHLCQSPYLTKLQAKACNFLKKETLAQVFPVNFVEFPRTSPVAAFVEIAEKHICCSHLKKTLNIAIKLRFL